MRCQCEIRPLPLHRQPAASTSRLSSSPPLWIHLGWPDCHLCPEPGKNMNGFNQITLTDAELEDMSVIIALAITVNTCSLLCSFMNIRNTTKCFLCFHIYLNFWECIILWRFHVASTSPFWTYFDSNAATLWLLPYYWFTAGVEANFIVENIWQKTTPQ